MRSKHPCVSQTIDSKTQTKIAQEVAQCSGKVSAREERQDRRQQDAQASINQRLPKKESTGGSTMFKGYCTGIPGNMTVQFPCVIAGYSQFNYLGLGILVPTVLFFFFSLTAYYSLWAIHTHTCGCDVHTCIYLAKSLLVSLTQSHGVDLWHNPLLEKDTPLCVRVCI